jgi:hypothetical protein
MSSQPLYEYQHFTVPEGTETTVINYFAKFYWELVQTQKVDYTKFSMESDYPDMITGVQTIRVINKRIAYYTIDLQRNKKMEKYQQITNLEQEYHNASRRVKNMSEPQRPSIILNKLRKNYGKLQLRSVFHILLYVLTNVIYSIIFGTEPNAVSAILMVGGQNFLFWLYRKNIVDIKRKEIEDNPNILKNNPRFIEVNKRYDLYLSQKKDLTNRMKQIEEELVTL